MRSFGSLTNTLLSVGMEEVEEDNKVCKLSYLPSAFILSKRLKHILLLSLLFPFD